MIEAMAVRQIASGSNDGAAFATEGAGYPDSAASAAI
jgi:hypothetical protein